MNDNSFHLQLEFKTSREKVFSAVSLELDNWWGSQSEKIIKNGQIFRVSWGEPWYEFKVIEYIQHHKMVWECTDANQIIDGLNGVQKEWLGTKIHWKLKTIGNSTILNFKHEGLVTNFKCYDFCSKSWDYFLTEKLSKYLDGLKI